LLFPPDKQVRLNAKNGCPLSQKLNPKDIYMNPYFPSIPLFTCLAIKRLPADMLTDPPRPETIDLAGGMEKEAPLPVRKPSSEGASPLRQTSSRGRCSDGVYADPVHFIGTATRKEDQRTSAIGPDRGERFPGYADIDPCPGYGK
jgi:hypothetical protein